MTDNGIPYSDAPAEFDPQRDAVAILRGLYNAALAIVSGNARTRVRINDRWTDFGKGNYNELVVLYNTQLRLCRRNGLDVSGYPDLAPGSQFERGPPGSIFTPTPLRF